jgi:hypothetical protein
MVFGCSVRSQVEEVLNFDKAGFRVSVAPGEEILVPVYIKEVSMLLLKLL